jgi:hypothetical protein
VNRGYRAFLLGTATDLPTRAFVVAPRQTRANELFASLRKWNKVISSQEH